MVAFTIVPNAVRVGEHRLLAAMVFGREMDTCAVQRQLNVASPRCGPLQALFSISGPW